MVFGLQWDVMGSHRQEGWRHTGIPAVALIALVACLAPAVDAYAQDRTLYDQSSIDSRINAEVDRIQELYAAQGRTYSTPPHNKHNGMHLRINHTGCVLYAHAGLLTLLNIC